MVQTARMEPTEKMVLMVQMVRMEGMVLMEKMVETEQMVLMVQMVRMEGMVLMEKMVETEQMAIAWLLSIVENIQHPRLTTEPSTVLILSSTMVSITWHVLMLEPSLTWLLLTHPSGTLSVLSLRV